jgi:hypothetical protein
MTSRKKKSSDGIPITDRTAEVLRFLTAGDEGAARQKHNGGPWRVVREYLEVKEQEVRKLNRGAFAGFDAILAPTAERLEGLQRDVAHLLSTASRTNLASWTEHIATNPPSAEMIAFLLVYYEREVTAAGERAVQRQESARTEGARQANLAKAKEGKTMLARAAKALEAIRQSGGDMRARHIAGEIASRLGCNPATVRMARDRILKLK